MNVDEFLKSDAASGLDPALRLLLTSDGSITLLLQSMLLDLIEVEVLRQEEIELDNDVANMMTAPPGSGALSRDVWLTARGRRLVSASSVILLGELDPSLLLALRTSQKPLGWLLEKSGRPVIRDRIQIARDPGLTTPLSPDSDPSRPAWMRRYRMSISARPVALIQERFAPDLVGAR